MNAHSASKYASGQSQSMTDVDMDGVETHVSQLGVNDAISAASSSRSVSRRSTSEDEIMGERSDDDDSAVPGLSEDEGSDSDEEMHTKGRTTDTEHLQDKNSNDSDESATDRSLETDQNQEDKRLYSSESAASSTTSLQTEPSIISIPEAVYSAVPVSSELYIIPHSSKGFRWNEDLFLKSHQRRSLGVDDMYNDSEGSSSGSNEAGLVVHEILLDEDESKQILPS
ncbi:hypothetical protein BX616_000615 [Lobosporangium transversale]|nr:hypothetical protein BX616_000615 [Lobosporangium transversale]